MPIPEEEISRRYEEIFGEPIGPEKASGFAALLSSLDRANLRVIDPTLQGHLHADQRA